MINCMVTLLLGYVDVVTSGSQPIDPIFAQIVCDSLTRGQEDSLSFFVTRTERLYRSSDARFIVVAEYAARDHPLRDQFTVYVTCLLARCHLDLSCIVTLFLSVSARQISRMKYSDDVFART